jgi:hypothetical protein
MKIIYSTAIFLAGLTLVGCQSTQEQTESNIRAAQAKLRDDTSSCQATYPKERKTVMARVRCINSAFEAYPYWPAPDLVSVVNAERLVSAEHFRDGKISEAEYEREIAVSQSKAAGLEQSRVNANRAVSVMERPPVQPVMVMPMPGMVGSTYRPMCPPGPYGIACRGY